MDKILKWIEKHKILTIIIVIGVIFVPIIVIHSLFKWDIPCEWFKAKWGAGDVLGYFGDVLSFIGTVVLGYVAIRQTERANQLSNQLLDLEWKQRQPCLCIDGNQEYKIFVDQNEIEDIEKEYGIKDLRIKPYYINTSNRTGVATTIAIMVVTIKNTGGSDIRNISLKSNYCYLSAKMPEGYDECEVYMIEGDTNIKRGGKQKTFYRICAGIGYGK